ncbi:adenosylhomocysteine nucleosidase [Tistlia consotensis]|uniref:Adenosylhomocysteine nucleosidase n=1 Tax=Tistlia consotensis USBA 355 TaxID=560819 RepID=A0A1Y6B5J1_9PROT|nr:hypothetical protein [Tistlia consotensis]SME93349.1 adenosylhomocysteine nucleosidase [Tistlia consotensis USBA 355]SNR28604.1 adenosylhomocysteine nucleosidase [Tistlia consotensis]
MAGARPVGVLVGLASEARLLRRAARGLTPAPLIEVSAADPARAEAAAARLVAAGAAGLVSFGLAAGLDPALPPGSLLLPSEVVDPEGRRWPADAAWRGRLGLEAGAAPLAGCDLLLKTAADKAALAAASGAASADMESHLLARAAAGAGLPFLVLRAVADPAGLALPPAAWNVLDAEGRSRGLLVTGRLLRAPGQLPALLALARAAGRAERALGGALAVAARRLLVLG